MFSVAHKRLSHDFDHDHDHHTTLRLNPTRQRVGSLPQGHPGLWGTPVGPGRTPTVHRCPKGKAVGGPQQTTSDNERQTTTSLETNVLSENKCRQTCCQRRQRCWQTLVNSHGSGTCATITRRSRSTTIDMISTCQHESKWRRPGSSRRSRREMEPSPRRTSIRSPGTKRSTSRFRRIRTQTKLQT